MYTYMYTYTRGVIRLGTASIVALALAAAAVAPSATVAAKPEIHPARRITSITAKGTDGWQLQVTALVEAGKGGRGPIGFFTRGPHHEEVQYVGAKGRTTADGLIVGKAPGLGRTDVRFERTSETPVTFVPERGCKAEGKSATLKGVFRGRIEFHGEGGYTTVDRQSAPGEVQLVPRVVCPRAKHHSRPAPETTEEAGIEYLAAGRDEKGGGSLSFEAFAMGLHLGADQPLTDFSATYTHKHGRLLILASTRVLAEQEGVLALTAPEGTPTEATVDPPAPFSGSAAFKLETPTTASWTGDLSVEVPTLGRVSLAEPGFWAGACAAHCTKTFPGRVSFGFYTVSRLP